MTAPFSIWGETHRAAIDACTACAAIEALQPHLSTSSTSSVSICVIAALSVTSRAELLACLPERGVRPCSQVNNHCYITLEQEQPADTSEAVNACSERLAYEHLSRMTGLQCLKQQQRHDCAAYHVHGSPCHWSSILEKSGGGQRRLWLQRVGLSLCN